MSKPRKRKAATFSKKNCDYKIELNNNMLAVGKNYNDFTTWFGVHLKANFSYHIPSSEFEEHKWEELWMDIKTTWNIKSDAAKKTMLKKARKDHTDWRSYLTRNYVRMNTKPFKMYPNLEEEHWEAFVTERSTSKFLIKSEKSTASAKANLFPNCLGRKGFANFDVESVWSQLLPKYSCLHNIQDERSKKWIASHAKRDKLTNTYELTEETKTSSLSLAEFEKEMIEDGSYFSGKEDPLTRLLGPEHGGRSRTTSHIIAPSKVHGGLFQGSRQQKQDNLPTATSYLGASDTPSGSHIHYPLIKECTSCELLFPYPSGEEIIVGTGLVYPSVDRTLNGENMDKDYVKVKVDSIDQNFKSTPLPKVSCYNEVTNLCQACGSFVQWPRFAIKLPSTYTTSCNEPLTQSTYDVSCYIPQFSQVDEQNKTYHQIDSTTVGNFEDVFVAGAPLFTQHDVDVLKELDTMFSNEVLVKQPPTPKLSKLQQDIQTAMKKILTERPEKIKSLTSRLTHHFADEMSIQVNVPKGMYPELETEFDIQNDHVEYEAMLQFLANGWLDASVLHWCEMYLYTLQKQETRDTQVAFFNAQKITGEECNNNFANVKEHLFQVYKLHHNKKYFLAPFYHSNHWVLFIISPIEHKCWILDSLSVRGKKKKSDYPLSKAVEASFGGAFTWNMVKCKQQEEFWECGYLVIRNMFEFVIGLQFSFPKKIWNDTTNIKHEEIDKLVENIMKRFFISVFDDKMSEIEHHLA